MSPVVLGIIGSLLLGIASNSIYDVVRGMVHYRRSNSGVVLGDYWAYWYNSKNIKRLADKRVSEAIVTIKRNLLFQLRATFVEIDRKDQNFEGYHYVGVPKLLDGQLHFRMHGKNHLETYYAVFENSLAASPKQRLGLILLTSNSNPPEPMTIRCVLSRETLDDDLLRKVLGKKDWLSARR